MISFEIPGLPKTPNQLLGAHWRVRSRHKHTWLKLVHLAIRTQLPKVPHPTAKLTLTRFSSVEPDTDNLRGSFKAIIDSLVQLKVIVNDKRENIGEPTVLWEKIAPKHGKIRVVVQFDTQLIDTNSVRKGNLVMTETPFTSADAERLAIENEALRLELERRLQEIVLLKATFKYREPKMPSPKGAA